VIEYCARRLPRWNFINVCGYHGRPAPIEPEDELVEVVGQVLSAHTAVSAPPARLHEVPPARVFRGKAHLELGEGLREVGPRQQGFLARHHNISRDAESTG
jgi:hypothetical protein